MLARISPVPFVADVVLRREAQLGAGRSGRKLDLGNLHSPRELAHDLVVPRDARRWQGKFVDSPGSSRVLETGARQG